MKYNVENKSTEKGLINRPNKEVNADEYIDILEKRNKFKDKQVKNMYTQLDNAKQEIKERDKKIEELLKKELPDSVLVLNKHDIMKIFNKESDFALRFFRASKAAGFSTKVGKEYYISRDNFRKFLKTYQGQEFCI